MTTHNLTTRPDWIAAIVRKKARILGADPHNPVHAALLAYESGATAHRAIRVGVERAGWETDPGLREGDRVSASIDGAPTDVRKGAGCFVFSPKLR